VKADEAHPLFESRIVDKKLDVVRPCEGVIAEGELHRRRFEIPNPGGDDLWTFVGLERLLRSDDDDMPGFLYLGAVGLLDRWLKIPADHQLSRIGGGYRVVENSVVPAHPQRGPARLLSRGATLVPVAAEPGDLRIRETQLPMIRRSKDVDVQIEGRRRDIGTAMGVMRGVAFRRPVALTCLPDDMKIGDPAGFDVGTVEKDPQSLSSFADNAVHIDSPKTPRSTSISVCW
jgi:hypothetical protein